MRVKITFDAHGQSAKTLVPIANISMRKTECQNLPSQNSQGILSKLVPTKPKFD